MTSVAFVDVPVLTADRLLVHAGRIVRLSVAECAVVTMLLERHPDPVEARVLERALRPGTEPDLRLTPRRLMQLRRRLVVVGMALRCQQRVGYTLELSEAG